MKGGIGPHLRALRVARKLTQQSLARLAGISQQHLSYLEQGRGGVELETLRKIIDVLGYELFIAPRARARPTQSALRAKAKRIGVMRHRLAQIRVEPR